MALRGGLRLLRQAQSVVEQRCASEGRLLCCELHDTRGFASALPQEALDEPPQNVKDGKVRTST